ncbi:hypothetical protein K432DRAFT_444141 [Lepidopterella palustris CBS 459.81]|uniref:Uncharacterized protein n=1 Tax=Lepidopterella palustris CBS 459.81 TaxID=1314670 RepID=A0A8E2E834_9PEZI|nr:hypothetical protein K432DRAFT_444141 [Lepidopterella palustris CBS 459.81]
MSPNFKNWNGSLNSREDDMESSNRIRADILIHDTRTGSPIVAIQSTRKRTSIVFITMRRQEWVSVASMTAHFAWTMGSHRILSMPDATAANANTSLRRVSLLKKWWRVWGGWTLESLNWACVLGEKYGCEGLVEKPYGETGEDDQQWSPYSGTEDILTHGNCQHYGATMRKEIDKSADTT